MPPRTFLGRIREKTANHIVGVTSGAIPVKALDTPSAFNIILALTVIAVIGSGFIIYRGIGQATKYRPTLANANTSAVSELAKLREKDTDQDQLSDYDELFSYQTSPYLKDSDGDGLTDQDELSSRKDPNCPQGKICSGITAGLTAADSSGRLTPDFLRQALRASGVPQATLDGTSDAELLRIFQSTIGIDGAGTGNTNTVSTVGDLQSLTSGEIRELLIQNGVAQESLDSVDDATIKKIFEQAAKTNQ